MKEQVEIRKVKIEDARTLAYIQTESWKSAFNEILSEEDLKKYTSVEKAEEMYTTLLEKEVGNGYLLLIDGKPHCILFWDKARDEKMGHLAELICIHSLSENWGEGYGSMMLSFALREMQKAGFEKVILWVFADNGRARKFYEKQEFALTEHTKEFCGAVEVMYEKELVF